MHGEDTTKQSLKAKKNEELKQVIYCGPDIGNVLRQNAIFLGDLPIGVKEQIENCPEIQRFFADITQASILKNAINDNGSSANIFYDKILNYVKELS